MHLISSIVRKKRLGAMIFVLIVIPLFGNPTFGQERPKLTIAIAGGAGSEDMLRPNIQRFSELYDVDVEITILPSGTTNRVDHLAVRYVGGIVTDVAHINTRAGIELFGAGMLLDLRPYIDNDPDMNLSDFIPITTKVFSMSDSQVVWAIPQQVVLRGLATNLDILDASGLQHPNDVGNDDWTWQTFEQYAKKVTHTDGDGSVQQMGMRWTDSLSPILVFQAGGYLFDDISDPTESGLLLPETISALEKYVEWFHPHPIARRSGGIRNGDLAFSLTTSSSITDMARTGTGSSFFEWDVSRWPLGPDNNAHEGNVTGFAVFNNTPYPDLAWELVKFLGTDKKVAQDTVNLRGRPTAYIPNLDTFAPNNWPEGTPAGYHLFQEMLLHPKLAMKPGFIGYDDFVTTYRELVRQAIEGKISVDEVVEESHRQAQRVLKEYEYVD